MRVFALAVFAAGLLSMDAGAQAPPQIVNTTAMDQAQDVHTPVPLWPAGAPGAVGKAEVDTPTVSMYLPSYNPTKTAVVVAPGGGYEHLAMDHEGLQVAQWLNAHGIAALVLKYRLGPTYHYPVEIEDGQRAVRYARAHATALGVQADRIGMWGFSAGGHLTATVGVMGAAGDPGAADAVDRVSSRPDFLVLAYPVISMEDGVTHGGSQRNLLGADATAAQKAALSADEHVTAQTPPTFLWATTDDNVVPVENSVRMYTALVKAGVSAEMHLYQHGPHGVGLAQANPRLSAWPDVLYAWLHANGWAQ